MSTKSVRLNHVSLIWKKNSHRCVTDDLKKIKESNQYDRTISPISIVGHFLFKCHLRILSPTNNVISFSIYRNKHIVNDSRLLNRRWMTCRAWMKQRMWRRVSLALCTYHQHHHDRQETEIRSQQFEQKKTIPSGLFLAVKYNCAILVYFKQTHHQSFHIYTQRHFSSDLMRNSVLKIDSPTFSLSLSHTSSVCHCLPGRYTRIV